MFVATFFVLSFTSYSINRNVMMEIMKFYVWIFVGSHYALFLDVYTNFAVSCELFCQYGVKIHESNLIFETYISLLI